MDWHTVIIYVESFCSCAISGNKLGIYMCELWRKDKVKFIYELNDWLDNIKVWNGEKMVTARRKK